jgi:predicted nuclease of predicted toxin-antitoxin system
MKIKLDENLPVELVPELTALGHDVHTPRDEGLHSAPDEAIWEQAQREQRFLVTQDLGFSDARHFAPGSHHGILIVRLKEPSRQALLDRIRGLFREEEVTTWTRCLVVASERKVRVRRPAGPTV